MNIMLLHLRLRGHGLDLLVKKPDNDTSRSHYHPIETQSTAQAGIDL